MNTVVAVVVVVVVVAGVSNEAAVCGGITEKKGERTRKRYVFFRKKNKKDETFLPAHGLKSRDLLEKAKKKRKKVFFWVFSAGALLSICLMTRPSLPRNKHTHKSEGFLEAAAAAAAAADGPKK